MPELFIIDTVQTVAFAFLRFWWLWSFFILVLILPFLWLAYVQEYWKRSLKYVLLELKMPLEVRKSPRAMEQVFQMLHSLGGGPANIEETWWDGEVMPWYSCEVVSFGGEIHFYMHVPNKHRNMIEASLYAHYADIQISEVPDDYINRLPPTYEDLKKEGYELFGNELVLAKPDAYPIRTYVDFEEKEEEHQLDPMGNLLEVLTKAKPQEILWLQIIVRVNEGSWSKDAEKLVDDLKAKAAKTPLLTETGTTVYTTAAPGEVEVMKAISRNLTKSGFDTVIRYLYISPKDIHSTNFGQRAIHTALNQYASQTFNRFRHNYAAWTRANIWNFPHLFPKLRKRARQERIYWNYRRRHMYSETFVGTVLESKWYHFGFSARASSKMVLNTEELATIFHPPTIAVQTGPLIKRVEARKVGPPAGLPIYGEEGEELPGINPKS